MQKTLRLKRELQMLQQSPPHGICCWQEDCTDLLKAKIIGSNETPYEGGVFNLDVVIPDRYPFVPPKVKFTTPIYHPNIDDGGRICMDGLKMPPKGDWKPCLNISSILMDVRLLMANPNVSDPLMLDIAAEFKYNKQLFFKKAKEYTRLHARGKNQSEEKRSSSAVPALQVDKNELQLVDDDISQCSGYSFNSRKRPSSGDESNTKKPRSSV